MNSFSQESPFSPETRFRARFDGAVARSRWARFARKRQGVAANANTDEPEALNPFVPMPRWAVVAALMFGGVYALVVCSVALHKAGLEGASMVWVALSSAWLIFWVFFPFVFYKHAYGWCHPLILGALLGVMNLVPRSTSLFMSGLPDHIMLPGWSSEELNTLFTYGNLVNSLALIAMYAGFSLGPRLGVPKFDAATVARPRLYPVLLIFLGISLTAFWFYAQAYGGLTSQLKSLAFGMAKKIELAGDLEGIGQYTVAMGMATIGAVVWVCAQPNAFRNPIFCTVAASALVLAYVSEGKRSHMIYPAILIMLCWTLRNRRVPYTRFALVGVGAFFLLGLLGLFRTANWTDTDNLNLHFIHDTSLAEVSTGSLDELARRSGSEFTFYPILAKVPHEEGLLYGKTYIEWGLRFIPREFWPDKPRGVDVQATQTFYDGDWGMPPSNVGEAYWNFHIPGVLAVFFLLGIFKRWLGNLLLHYPNAPAVMVVYMISLFYFDASQNGFRAWLYAIVPALLMLRLGGLIRGGRRSSNLLGGAVRPTSVRCLNSNGIIAHR